MEKDHIKLAQQDGQNTANVDEEQKGDFDTELRVDQPQKVNLSEQVEESLKLIPKKKKKLYAVGLIALLVVCGIFYYSVIAKEGKFQEIKSKDLQKREMAYQQREKEMQEKELSREQKEKELKEIEAEQLIKEKQLLEKEQQSSDKEKTQQEKEKQLQEKQQKIEKEAEEATKKQKQEEIDRAQRESELKQKEREQQQKELLQKSKEAEQKSKEAEQKQKEAEQKLKEVQQQQIEKGQQQKELQLKEKESQLKQKEDKGKLTEEKEKQLIEKEKAISHIEQQQSQKEQELQKREKEVKEKEDKQPQKGEHGFYVPEDQIVYNLEPSTDIGIIDNVTVTSSDRFLLVAPQYFDEHIMRLKIMDIRDKKTEKVTIYINGVSKEILVNNDYETQYLYFPQLTFKRKVFNQTSHIPRIIVQTSEGNNITRKKYLTMRSIIDNNPNFRYVHYNNEERIKFIKENFNQSVLQAYLDLVPGANRADIFRLCYLYVYGGIYMDLKLQARTNYDKLVTSGYDMIFCLDWGGARLYQNTMVASVPHYQPLLDTINLMADNVRRRDYQRNCLSITGPGALYDGVNPFMNRDGYKGKIKILTPTVDSNNFALMHDPEFGDVAHFGFPGYYDENYYYKYQHCTYYAQRKTFRPS